ARRPVGADIQARPVGADAHALCAGARDIRDVDHLDLVRLGVHNRDVGGSSVVAAGVHVFAVGAHGDVADAERQRIGGDDGVGGRVDGGDRVVCGRRRADVGPGGVLAVDDDRIGLVDAVDGLRDAV